MDAHNPFDLDVLYPHETHIFIMESRADQINATYVPFLITLPLFQANITTSLQLSNQFMNG